MKVTNKLIGKTQIAVGILILIVVIPAIYIMYTELTDEASCAFWGSPSLINPTSGNEHQCDNYVHITDWYGNENSTIVTLDAGYMNAGVTLYMVSTSTMIISGLIGVFFILQGLANTREI